MALDHPGGELVRVEARLELLEAFLKEVEKWAKEYALDEDGMAYLELVDQQKISAGMIAPHRS